MVSLLSPCYNTRLLNRQEDPFTEIVVYPTILALVTSAETAPPLARAQTKIVDCADEDRRLRRRRSSTALTTVGDCACEKYKSGKGVEFGMRLMGIRSAAVRQPISGCGDFGSAAVVILLISLNSAV